MYIILYISIKDGRAHIWLILTSVPIQEFKLLKYTWTMDINIVIYHHPVFDNFKTFPIAANR